MVSLRRVPVLLPFTNGVGRTGQLSPKLVRSVVLVVVPATGAVSNGMCFIRQRCYMLRSGRNGVSTANVN